MLECQAKWTAGLKGGSVEAGEELEDVAGAVGQGVADFAAVVTLEDQAGQHQPAKMLAGGFHFDLQFLANLADAKIRAASQQLENFDPAMVGKTFDHTLQLFGPRPLGPNDAFARSHPLL